MTERTKKTEEMLRASEERARLLALVVQHCPDFIGVSDIERIPVFVNEAGLDLVGLTWQQAQATPVPEYFSAEEQAFVREVVLPAVLEEGRWIGELHLRHFQTGEAIPVLYNVFRVDDPVTGEPVNFATVIRDLTEQKQVEEALRESEERQRIAVATAGLGVFEWNVPEDYSVWENDRMFEIFGHAPADGTLNRHEFFTSYLLADDAEAFDAALREAMKPGASFEAVGRIRRKSDGALRWVEVAGNFTFAPDGSPLKLRGVVADISERREREQQVRLLMQEVNHRAKNLLTVVQAIARQTAGRSRPEEFAGALIDRLHGLAASQDLIIGGDWRSVALANLVRSQLDLLGDRAQQRVHVMGEPIMVTPAAAQGIGMALHELATNALKHGALSNDTGHVSIAWSRVRAGGSGRFNIEWSEHGGPAVEAPKHNGFGRTVIERMAAHAVSGEVELRHDPTGVRWRLVAPEEAVIYRGGSGARQALDGNP